MLIVPTGSDQGNAQNFCKIYKTLVGALTHTCTLCTHLYSPSSSQEKALYVTLCKQKKNRSRGKAFAMWIMSMSTYIGSHNKTIFKPCLCQHFCLFFTVQSIASSSASRSLPAYTSPHTNRNISGTEHSTNPPPCFFVHVYHHNTLTQREFISQQCWTKRSIHELLSSVLTCMETRFWSITMIPIP